MPLEPPSCVMTDFPQDDAANEEFLKAVTECCTFGKCEDLFGSCASAVGIDNHWINLTGDCLRRARASTGAAAQGM